MTAEEDSKVFPLRIQFADKETSVLVNHGSELLHIAQYVHDAPFFDYQTCFNLAYNGRKLELHWTVGDIPDFKQEDAIQVVDREFNENEARQHLVRVRQLLSKYRNVPKQGIDAGASLLNNLDKVGQDSFKKGVPEIKWSIFYPEQKTVECVKDMAVSKFNPPTMADKMNGHLLYLTIQTLEGKELEVISSVDGFTVKSKTFRSLISLLNHESPLFKTRFEALQKEYQEKTFLEFANVNQPSYPWLVRKPVKTQDSARTLDVYLNAAEISDTLVSRDWNDDLQGARDLPRETGQQAVVREEAVFKSYADFVEAAVKGAVLFLAGSLPNNSMDPDCAIHNNIFFSPGYDNKELFEQYGGEAAAHVAVSKDVDGVRLLSRSHLDVYTLSTAVIDYKGHRLVAQGIVPGILKRSENQPSLVQYGSADNGKTIQTETEFKETMDKIADAFHFKKHTVVDEAGNKHEMRSSIDVKGLLSTDGRRYLLDLYRFNPVDITFLEACDKEGTPYPHRMALIRPELIEFFLQQKVRKIVQEYQEKKEAYEQKKTTEKPEEPDLTNFKFEFNPDAYTLANIEEKEDEHVRELSEFVNVMISSLVLDFVQMRLSVPGDSASLVLLMHSRGINMRYLGTLAQFFDQITDFPIPHLKHLLHREMVSRAAKHLLRGYLKPVPLHKTAQVIAHFFNCLFGKASSIGEEEWQQLDSEKLAEMIKEQVGQRFRYQLTQDVKHPLLLLRNICRQVGIQMEAKEYEFGKNKPFSPANVLSIYPIIKDAMPTSAIAEEILEQGNLNFTQDKKESGLDLVRQSISLYEQICGPLHLDTARAYSHHAMLLFKEKQMEEAIRLQKRAVVALERLLGLDAWETIQGYGYLAFYEHTAGNTQEGLKLMKHTLQLHQFIFGGELNTDHPNQLTTLAYMLSAIGKDETAIEFAERSVEITLQIWAPGHRFAIAAQDALVKLYIKAKAFRKALNVQKSLTKAVSDFYGPTHELTESKNKQLQEITQQAVEQARQQKLNR
ncbi:clustered mitochondria-domain-containing protein [Gorgonomyces haynaldii]|nr:clustered mitochondria-domain-containing protein [Gorgonomyces haynaldii]